MASTNGIITRLCSDVTLRKGVAGLLPNRKNFCSSNLLLKISHMMSLFPRPALEYRCDGFQVRVGF